jgi:hypothetical protein
VGETVLYDGTDPNVAAKVRFGMGDYWGTWRRASARWRILLNQSIIGVLRRQDDGRHRDAVTSSSSASKECRAVQEG